MTEQTNTQNQTNNGQAEFGIQRLYVKDASFEAPSTPQIFRSEWKPDLNLNLDTKATELEKNVYEITLTVTVTAKVGNETAFLAEVKQAGIFAVQNFSKEQLGPLLGSFCPNILFPYAREMITDLVVRGGFPPLYLSPINFDELYKQHLTEQGQKGGAQGEGKPESGIIQTH
jgi:preprotein translocase subunit SecB